MLIRVDDEVLLLPLEIVSVRSPTIPAEAKGGGLGCFSCSKPPPPPGEVQGGFDLLPDFFLRNPKSFLDFAPVC